MKEERHAFSQISFSVLTPFLSSFGPFHSLSKYERKNGKTEMAHKADDSPIIVGFEIATLSGKTTLQ